LASQQRQPHPLTQAAPGGWGWTDSTAAVPDTDDTAGALLALVVLSNSGRSANRQRIEESAGNGLDWLLAVQNPDGGWPGFCRGRGYWPFDRSGSDVTAHALRAIHAWRHAFPQRNVEEPIRRGLDYLAAQQKPDGHWTPLWFGNQNCVDDENPVYGTARVVLAYRDLGLIESEPAKRGLKWLVANIDSGGGWGGGPASGSSSVEETALAVEALLAARNDPSLQSVVNEGLQWLVKAIGQQRHRQPAPIGFCLAKLWYYERVYPLAFTVAALGQAIKQYTPGIVEEGKQPARP
jgi:squalene-hopene/tetraprenyl-beta-curcumene cyclase